VAKIHEKVGKTQCRPEKYVRATIRTATSNENTESTNGSLVEMVALTHGDVTSLNVYISISFFFIVPVRLMDKWCKLGLVELMKTHRRYEKT
jgi:hypothetical protein